MVDLSTKSRKELLERIWYFEQIALSALALKLTIEHDLEPNLTALDRDLDAYQRRFAEILHKEESDGGSE